MSGKRQPKQGRHMKLDEKRGGKADGLIAGADRFLNEIDSYYLDHVTQATRSDRVGEMCCSGMSRLLP
jgi:hypothetical protein